MSDNENINGGNPFDLVDNIKNTEKPQNTMDKFSSTIQNTEKGIDTLIKKFIRFLARISGETDPETGESFAPKTSNNTESIGNGESIENKKISFDSVMSGVNNFINKIGKQKSES